VHIVVLDREQLLQVLATRAELANSLDKEAELEGLLDLAQEEELLKLKA
jgi:hypothetical protein